jgi:hypothetical protein
LPHPGDAQHVENARREVSRIASKRGWWLLRTERCLKSMIHGCAILTLTPGRNLCPG